MPTVHQALRLLDQRIADVLQAFQLARSALEAKAGSVQAASKIERIQHLTADHFGFSRSRLVSRDRHADVAIARQVAMMLCRKYTKYSLQRIGQDFGGFEHGTVIYAVTAVINRTDTDAKFRTSVGSLMTRLELALQEASTPDAKGFRALGKIGEFSKESVGKHSKGATRG